MEREDPGTQTHTCHIVHMEWKFSPFTVDSRDGIPVVGPILQTLLPTEPARNAPHFI